MIISITLPILFGLSLFSKSISPGLSPKFKVPFLSLQIRVAEPENAQFDDLGRARKIQLILVEIRSRITRLQASKVFDRKHSLFTQLKARYGGKTFGHRRVVWRQDVVLNYYVLMVSHCNEAFYYCLHIGGVRADAEM